MNFLAHAALAESGSDDFLFGNLIADGIRGSHLNDWPEAVVQGIRYHRYVDATIDRHPATLALRRRITGPERRVAGIAFDLLWDHFLARDCIHEPDGRALIARSYQVLEKRQEKVPARLTNTVALLCQHDWLSRYSDFEFTCQAISGVGERLTGINRLARLIPWVRSHYPVLATTFREVWPDMLALRQEAEIIPAPIRSAR
ncbi:ACP phosphodiesterase [Kushneria phosphatilytica]|uniref:DUF479 domain-containing protein n=1 Tax=Kushneria phosphatilytica TaxID=657387 RepID=A0A1S1NX04_9GAMM|nr:ACP phosphodiesterase [Kushneria phosphatilytica]OHV11906.1 hypothetical protein BH688_04285 [Kushneria phosphatilytica]QEL11081.1 DUF479 domain-containing protein [Kushneria phosphatilytica]